jgi:aspartyl-tRNA(Asn)/glutamyl-tRNA(Gln) amidotransferase subunit B
MNKYTPVIGLEVHVELNTKTKMFCRCSADYFGKEPNTQTCPVCLGLPGATPVINEEAIRKCIQIGLALNCTVKQSSRFERKNYFYPDLPKSYQISQYRWPLCVKGFLEVNGKKFTINRVHQEEDTAKLVHQIGSTNFQETNSNGTGIDFNRSSVPLVEIVTEPDFDNAQDVVDFAKSLQQILRDLGVSNADMERGDMRLEANVSVRPEGQTELPNYRVELKNINSFRFMKQAMEYEFKRQEEALEKGEKLVQETRGWDEAKQITYSQRAKEEAHDYRYFPDPDLPELNLSANFIDEVKASLPELSSQKATRLSLEHDVPVSHMTTLVNQGSGDYFVQAVPHAKEAGLHPKEIVNAIVNKRVDIEKVAPHELAIIIKSQKQSNISNEDLTKAVEEAINNNPKVVEDYKNGKTVALQFLIGQVMKITRGQATAENVKNALEEKLQ